MVLEDIPIRINISNGDIEAPNGQDAAFITIPCTEAKGGKLVLLVDTGADSSLIIEEAMKVYLNQNISEIKTLTGAFGGGATTLFSTTLNIKGKEHIKWDFHVVSNGSKYSGETIFGEIV